MFKIIEVVQPETIEEAYRVLSCNQNSAILGGCAFLRLSSKKIAKAIDLSKLDLGYIKDLDGVIEIGAMATLRDIEINSVFDNHFSSVLHNAVNQIMGVQFRNIVTVGATVYSKYGFSDLITPLLALDTEVELYKNGCMSLEKFLDEPCGKDILTRIFIKKNQRRAAYLNIRNSATDYSILNVTVSNLGDEWRVVVGARPQRAKIAVKASKALSQGALGEENITKAAGITAEEISFGSNIRGSAEYRKAMCRVLVKRAAEGVLQCR